MKNLIDHFALFSQMSSIKRFSRDWMAKPENVLEHTGFVVLFCLFVAKKLAANADAHFVMGELLEKAAVHDLDEPVLGDVPRPTKYMSAVASNEFKMAEERAVERIGEFFGIDIICSWSVAKDHTPEGRLVAIADLAAVVYAVWQEVALFGNRSFLRVQKELYEVLNRMQSTPGWVWEQELLRELLDIVVDLRTEDRGHPELSSALKLDSFLKEDADAEKDEREEGPNEIPF